MPSSLTLQRSLKDDVAVISIDGFLDAHTAPQFEQALQQEIADGRVKLVVDCAKLTYISSAGLGVFMGFIEEVREQRGDIKVCGLTRRSGRCSISSASTPSSSCSRTCRARSIGSAPIARRRGRLDERGHRADVHLHVPSSTENLVLIREFVTSIATRAGLDQSDVAKLELAVDEACANVIEHAYQHDSSKEVTVAPSSTMRR